ncbi:hypothetical protein CYMTET_3926, partial [Cymbomonas tetramitiformis]
MESQGGARIPMPPCSPQPPDISLRGENAGEDRPSTAVHAGRRLVVSTPTVFQTEVALTLPLPATENPTKTGQAEGASTRPQSARGSHALETQEERAFKRPQSARVRQTLNVQEEGASTRPQSGPGIRTSKVQNQKVSTTARPRSATWNQTKAPENNGTPPRPQTAKPRRASTVQVEGADSTRRSSAPESRATYTRFWFKGRSMSHPVSGHLDAYSSWEGDPELDCSVWAKSERPFARVQYAVKESRWSNTVTPEQAEWAHFKSEKVVDIEDLAKWVRTLVPRCKTDLKPLLILIQGVVQALLDKELKLYAPQVNDLSEKLCLANSKIKALRHINEEAVQDSKNKVKSMERLNLFRKMSYQGFSKNPSSSKLAEEQEERSVARALQDEMEREEQALIVSELMEKNTALEAELQDLENQIDKFERQKDKLELMARQIDDLENTIQIKDALVNKLYQEKKDLQTEVNGLKEKSETLLASWATYRPAVELEWASQLVTGQTTLTCPWASTITLPKSSKMPHHLHLAELPGGSLVALPDVSLLAEVPPLVGMPPFSRLLLPEGVQLAEVIVPSGTSIILPADTVSKYTVTVPGGSHLLHAKDDAEDSEEPQNELVPPGPSSVVTLSKGSTIVVPMKNRYTVKVPSRCRYVVPVGQRRLIGVPPCSTLEIPDGQDSVVVAPICTTILLPQRPSGVDGAAVLEQQSSTFLTGGSIEVGEHNKAEVGNCMVFLPAGSEILAPQLEDPPDGYKLTLPPGSLVVPTRQHDDRENPLTVPNNMDGEDINEEKQQEQQQVQQQVQQQEEKEEEEEEEVAELAMEARGQAISRWEWIRSTKIVGATTKINTTVYVPPGVRIVLPEDEYQSMSHLAERMLHAGFEAVAAAAGELEPRLVVRAFCEKGILNDQAVAEIIGLMRPQVAARVIKAFPSKRLPQIVELLEEDMAACIFAQLGDRAAYSLLAG